MSSPVNFPLLISQLPYVQQMQHVESTHPEVQQVLVAQQAFEQHLKQMEQVQVVEKGDNLSGVDDKKKREADAKRRQAQRKRQAKAAGPEEEGGRSLNPWSGNIIDRKI